MLPEQIGYVTIAFSLLGAAFYIKDILRGTTRPNLVTWIIWAAAPLIGAFFQIQAGAGLSFLPILMGGVSPLLIVLVALVHRQTYWKLTSFDLVCGAFAVAALVLYVLTHNLDISILFVILSDALAAVPTIVKTWKFPETETMAEYLLSVINAIIGILIIKEWSFTIYSFGVYLILLNLLVVILIYRKKIFRTPKLVR